MSILGKYIKEEDIEESTYVKPAILKNDDEAISFKKSLILSTILHPASVGVGYLIMLLLMFMGIKFTMFDKPVTKTRDIEFVLVDKEDTPINKNTPYRADRNSRAGGHHDPKRKVSMPSPAPGKIQKTSQPAAAQKAAPKKAPAQPQNPIQKIVKQVTQQPAAKPAAKPQVKPQPKPAPVKQQAKPAPPTARPSIKPPMTPKVVKKPSSPFSVPIPPGGTKQGHYATGPISGSGTASKGGSSATGGGRTSGGFSPAPILAPTGGGSSSGSKLAKGGGGGSGGGNPGPGNPNGRPGIDAIREPDFGPYMRELQRRIKMNWDPPKGNESKRVVLLFKIAKDGRLLSCSVYKSSGLPTCDKAAINAVQTTAPFRPLPAEYKGSSIDIQFTFDYNVFGASGYQ